jgi:branched-chain amino acid transport system substrate-binding protein
MTDEPLQPQPAPGAPGPEEARTPVVPQIPVVQQPPAPPAWPGDPAARTAYPLPPPPPTPLPRPPALARPATPYRPAPGPRLLALPDTGGPKRRPPSNIALVVALVAVIAVGGLAAVAALGSHGGSPVVAAATPTSRPIEVAPAAPIAGGRLTIGISLPMTGDQLRRMDPIRAAVEMAVADANQRHAIPGFTVTTKLLDHGYGEGIDDAKAITDMESFSEDPTVVGVVGPYYDPTAVDLAPLAASSSIVLCSPSNHMAALTLGPEAAAMYPEGTSRTYLRVNSPDTRGGAALALYARHDLGAARAVVGDDGTEFGRAIVDTFRRQFETDGGTIAGTFDGTDGIDTLDLQLIETQGVRAVVFGSDTAGDGAQLRARMDVAGLRDVALLGGPALNDGYATEAGTFASNVLFMPGDPGPVYAFDPVQLDFDGETAFDRRLKDASGLDSGWYGSAGYTCAETILNAARAAAAAGPVTRQAIRDVAMSPDTAFTGLWGRVQFDANGDIAPYTYTVWQLDAKTEHGWTWARQVVVLHGTADQ